MDIEKKLELLKKIQKVDVPPFLLTRIMERIDSATIEKAPTFWRLAFIALSMVVLALNVSILFKPSDKQNKQGIEEVISSMELSTSNELYHD
jgi:hypothetical protein